MTKWEYKHVGEYMYQHELNELGQQGWELAGFSAHHTGGALGSNVYTYIFKRPIVE